MEEAGDSSRLYRGLGRAHGLGQHGAQDGFEGGAVISGGPAGQFEEARGEDRAFVQQGIDGAEPVFGFGLIGDGEDGAVRALPSQGHADAGTYGDPPGEFLRNQIGELEVGRSVDENLGAARHRREFRAIRVAGCGSIAPKTWRRTR